MLKSMNFSELEKCRDELNRWAGAQLQDVSGSDKEIGLKLYLSGSLLFLWIDLSPQRPVAILFEDRFPKHLKKLKPMHLFLRANFVGSRLAACDVDPSLGRVLKLNFSCDDGVLGLELRLFPGGQNAIAEAGGKRLSWAKVAELVPAQETRVFPEVRTPAEVRGQWLAERTPLARDMTSPMDAQKTVSQWKKDLAKKRRALEKLEETLEGEKDGLWKKAGEWLQAFGSALFPSRVPSEIAVRIDVKKSLSWNIENCFSRASQAKAKMEGRVSHLERLKNEIEELEKWIENPATAKKPEHKAKSVLSSSHARGRTKVFGEGFEAVLGRSAKDNLAILRAAKPWYLWMHLRDEPGAHLVLRRNRDQEVPEAVLHEAFAWLLSSSFGSRLASVEGQVFAVIVTECRHVQPIRGDRLGRVQFREERTLRLRAKSL